LLYGSVTEDDILLKRELEELENSHPNQLKVFYVVDEGSNTWPGPKGRITKDLIEQVLPGPEIGNKLKIFTCGPPGLYKAVSGEKKSPSDQGELSGYLKDLGYSKDQVYKF